MTKLHKKFSLIRFLLKTLFWLILAVAVLLIVAYLFLGTIVEKVITHLLPDVTGTSTAIEHVDLSLLKGHIEIRGLKIGNPDGFSDQSIFELGNITVKFQPKSVLTDKIMIDSVLISDTKVSAELKNLYSSESNIGALQKNINTYLGTDKKKAASKSTQPVSTADEGASKKVIIKDLKIQGTELSLGASGKTVTLPLPNIQQKNIGADKKEKSFADVMADILNLLSLESLKGIPAAVTDLAKQGAQLATGLAKDGLKNASDLINNGADAVSGGAKDAIDGIKGLFK